MQFFTPHYLCRSPYRGDLVRQLQVNIPLKPLPLALDPFPDGGAFGTSHSQSRKQTKVC